MFKKEITHISVAFTKRKSIWKHQWIKDVQWTGIAAGRHEKTDGAINTKKQVCRPLFKTSKESGRTDLFNAAPSSGNFFIAVAFSKPCETNPSREHKKQGCLQIELAEKCHNNITHRSHRGQHNKYNSRKNKIVTVNIKMFCLEARNWSETFWQT